MTQTDINNIKLAKYLGCNVITENNKTYIYLDSIQNPLYNLTDKIILSPDNLLFHKSYDWLMTVVVKLNETEHLSVNKNRDILYTLSYLMSAGYRIHDYYLKENLTIENLYHRLILVLFPTE